MINPFEEPNRSAKPLEPCILVIFGATGDLMGRKLAPALYNLGKEGQLPMQFACVGFARREKSHEQFRSELKQDIATYSRTKPLDEGFWQKFQEQVYYHQSDFDNDDGYQKLALFLRELDTKHATRKNRIFYLSVQPKYFPIIVEKLRKFNLIYDAHKPEEGFSRVVIEKPFGHDFSSAEELQTSISKYLHETQTYRIDHYLGKETVQNILIFRFANSIFESIWNYKHIDHVQITVAEEIGIGSRGAFFEEEGILRDVVQNHMMQLLSLIAMEPPVSLNASAIRDEKVKVLQSIRTQTEEEFARSCVRGQYSSGFINGKNALGYLQEQNVKETSTTETFIAMRLFVDNWRWDGVPFYLRAGKRLPKRATEIAIVFKDAPGVFFKQQGEPLEPNVLALRIQPDEGISMKINCKMPGPSNRTQPVKMDFLYGSYFGSAPPEAYERLIWDCMSGDGTLFARSDEVKTSWSILTPLLNLWARKTSSLPTYPCGSWGPKEAANLLANDNRAWRIL